MDVLLWRRAQRVPAGRGKKGGAAVDYIAEILGAHRPLFAQSSVECLTAKWFWVVQTWLGIWKCSPLCRGPLGPRSPETPQCLRRLQIARLCSSETVSKKKRRRERERKRVRGSQHRCVVVIHNWLHICVHTFVFSGVRAACHHMMQSHLARG